MAAVSTVKGYRIAGQKPPHHRGNRDLSGSHEQMHTVGNQHPGKTEGDRIGESIIQAVYEIFAIAFVRENAPASIPLTMI